MVRYERGHSSEVLELELLRNQLNICDDKHPQLTLTT